MASSDDKTVAGPAYSLGWRGAALGVLVVACVFLVVHVGIVIASPFPNLAGVIYPLALLASAALMGGVLLAVVSVLRRVPGFYLWTAVGFAWVLFVVPLGLGKTGVAATIFVIVAAASLAGGGLAVLLQRRVPAGGAWRQRALAASSLLLGCALFALGGWWLLWEGPQAPPGQVPPGPAPGAREAMPASTLTDPSRPGPHRVRTLYYGSGLDRHRPEFGQAVDIRTKSVDASLLIGGWDGVVGWARTRYWGFDVHSLPLQARVSYPEGKGPFPLVLIVHGNHMAEEYSEAGYDYLGRLLASRGYIVASVDQNFLNFSLVDLVRSEIGLSNEHRARGWLLLEHLRLWREWNGQAGNPFGGMVDLERIALIGHSLGGEAVAVAAALNRLEVLPDDARIGLSHGFGIRSVVALAPAEGGYLPGGNPASLENVNYLTLQGSHDLPVPRFDGAMQFERVRFTDGGDWFKATVYIDRANHGQFNAIWGRDDSLGLGHMFLNLRPLLTGQEQQRIAQVYVSAFLDATLAGAEGYRSVFRDQRAARAWLPDVFLLQQYQDASTRLVSTFEEDIDATTTTLPGGRITAQNLGEWREGPVPLKWGWLGTRALFLGWDSHTAKGAAKYLITLPEAGLGLGHKPVLTFRLANATRGDLTPLDLTIELIDAAGRTARQPLSHVSLLPPQLAAETLKARFLSNSPRSEPVFRDFEFPLADFAASDGEFQPTRLRTVAFVFDRTPSGKVILDDVGFR